jgi:hypothetical protein
MKTITLLNDSEILPTWLLIKVRECGYGKETWEILNISMFSDRTFDDAHLISDDIVFENLPGSTQLQIFAALNCFEHLELEQARRRMAAFAQLGLEGAYL